MSDLTTALEVVLGTIVFAEATWPLVNQWQKPIEENEPLECERLNALQNNTEQEGE